MNDLTPFQTYLLAAYAIFSNTYNHISAVLKGGNVWFFIGPDHLYVNCGYNYLEHDTVLSYK